MGNKNLQGSYCIKLSVVLGHIKTDGNIWSQHNYVVQTKMYPSISFSGTLQKQFLICRNRTNLWWRSHMYFLTCLPPSYVVSKIGLSTIRFFNSHLFSNVVIMTLNYVLCPILVQNPGKYTLWRYISIFSASTHINEQQHHSTTLLLYHLHTENIERQGSIRGRPIVVRDIITLI